MNNSEKIMSSGSRILVKVYFSNQHLAKSSSETASTNVALIAIS